MGMARGLDVNDAAAEEGDLGGGVDLRQGYLSAGRGGITCLEFRKSSEM